MIKPGRESKDSVRKIVMWQMKEFLNHNLKSSGVHLIDAEAERDIETFMVEKGQYGHTRRVAAGREVQAGVSACRA